MNDDNELEIEVMVKRIPQGTMRKYTKTEMENIFRAKHPELVQEVLKKSYLINNERHAVSVLVDIFIDECLDIDTLESDEERKKRKKNKPKPSDLWDLISEKV